MTSDTVRLSEVSEFIESTAPLVLEGSPSQEFTRLVVRSAYFALDRYERTLAPRSFAHAVDNLSFPTAVSLGKMLRAARFGDSKENHGFMGGVRIVESAIDKKAYR